GRGAGDGLSHRGNAEYRVERHRLRLIDRPPSESAFVEDAAIVGGQRDDAGNETRFDRFPEDVIDSHCWSNRHSASALRSHSNDARESVTVLQVAVNETGHRSLQL